MIFTPFPILKTQRLVLRKSNSDDLPQILFLRSDSDVNRFIKREPMKDLVEASAFVAKIENQLKKGECIEWIITIKGSSVMVGSICLWNFSDDRLQAEAGYALHPDYHGKGNNV